MLKILAEVDCSGSSKNHEVYRRARRSCAKREWLIRCAQILYMWHIAIIDAAVLGSVGRIYGRWKSSKGHEQKATASFGEDPRPTHRRHRRGDGHDDPHLRNEGSGHPRAAFQRCDERPFK